MLPADASQSGVLTRAETTSNLPETSRPIAQKPLILIIDDNRDAAAMLGILLSEDGYRVEIAYDGSKALKLAKALKPECVLLDVRMPGMDGYEVAKRLRQNEADKRTTIITVSGSGQAEDRFRSRQAGCNYHLCKPVAYDAIRSVMSVLGIRCPNVKLVNPNVNLRSSE